MSQEDTFINGELLRLRREARGWVLSDLATRACMSVKQIRQLEEGGMSSFYSAAVKMTSAKKVGALLGLSAEEVFAQEAQATAKPEAVESEAFVAELEVPSTEDKPAEAMSDLQVVVEIEVDTADHAPVASVVAEEPKSKTSLWIIAGLFASALAVAAYMQPQDEPVAEAAPPLQVLPADVADPASAASAADMSASLADVVASPVSVSSAVVNVQKTASSASIVSSSPRVAAPAASAASKAL